MPKIRTLPDNIINRIAAGEVVERPASVLKELLENSIDAKSTEIEIHIKDGGISQIMVIDNGEGMSRDDAPIAFERHSTSKLYRYEQLENINSMGFRGEALASIASVSMIDVKTKALGEAVGTEMKVEAGNIINIKDTPWNEGTLIDVKNLFFNTPGRRKFIKSVVSEYRQMLEIFRRVALSHPEISFKFYNNQKLMWDVGEQSLKDRAINLFGSEIEPHILEVDTGNKKLSLKGIITNPGYFKSRSGEQYFFLNKRYIKNKTVFHAIMQGYSNTLEGRGYPFCSLFLYINPRDIDINIHPAKLEAKFKNEKEIHDIVFFGVRNALKPEIDDFKESKKQFSNKNKEKSGEMKVISMQSSMFKREKARSKSESFNNLKSKEISADEEKIERENIWQMHNKYIFFQIASGICLIDQHAAHERILFEKAIKMMKGRKSASQQLLFPLSIHLNNMDMVIMEELIPLLNKIGFDVKMFGRNTIVLEAVPNDMRNGAENTIINEVIEEYKKDEYKDLDLYSKVASVYACRGAIMSGAKLSKQEMNKLIDELFQTEFPYFCPHGRPTIINLPLSEIDKKFGRS